MLTLTPAELAELTGRTRAGAQIRWLEREGCPAAAGYYWARADDGTLECLEIWNPGGAGWMVAETSVPVGEYAESIGANTVNWCGPLVPPPFDATQ